MFSNNSRGYKGGRGGFGGGYKGDRGSDRPMFDATCTECGESCQVPFRPSPGKSVKCRNCFKKDDVGGGFERPSFGGRGQDRGGFRGEGRGETRGATPPDTGKLLAQLARIEEKLDIMIEALMGNEETVEVDDSDEDEDEDDEMEGEEGDEKGDDKK